MNKKSRDEFYLKNKESIEKIVEFAIYENKQLLKRARSYVKEGKLTFTSYKKTKSIVSLHVNYEDVKQQLYLEIFEALRKRDNINLSYIEKLCNSRIKNMLRREFLEAKNWIYKKEFEAIDNSVSADVVVEDIDARIIIEKTLLVINDPKEKEYLMTQAGNCGVKGYEKHAISKTSTAEPDDLCIAKKLGFDNAKMNKYVVIKNNVKKVLAEVMKIHGDVAWLSC